MTIYNEMRAKADKEKILKQQKELILKNCLHFKVHDINIVQGNEKEDQQEATDFIASKKVTISARVRWLDKYPLKHIYRQEMTIRKVVIGGNITEYDKIMKGHGDYDLYCLADNDDNITDWLIMDLDEFRKDNNESYCRGHLDKIHYNPDGSGFYVYKLKLLKERNCILTSNWILDPDFFDTVKKL